MDGGDGIRNSSESDSDDEPLAKVCKLLLLDIQIQLNSYYCVVCAYC